MESDTDMDSPAEDAGKSSDQKNKDLDSDSVERPVSIKRRLCSGLLGLIVLLLGVALVVGHAGGLINQEPHLFMLVLIGLCMLWMLWYLLWVRTQPSFSPPRDHYAVKAHVTIVVNIFALFCLLLQVCRMGYFISTRECKPVVLVLSPFIETPFIALQTYFLWCHSKDCMQTYKIMTRIGLVVILSTNLLLWLSSVMEDTILDEITSEKNSSLPFPSANSSEEDLENLELSDFKGTENATCHCTGSTACTVFKKVFEILYPFLKEFYVMASTMIYVMWTNVGRKMNSGDYNAPYKLTANWLSDCRIFCSRVFGGLVLLVGVTFFILYQIFDGMPNLSSIAILLFYSYHIATLPLMFLYSLAGMFFHGREHRMRKGKCTCTWTCSKNVLLLLGASLGQLILSWSSLLTAFSVGIEEVEEGLDLSYSILSLLEIILQNILILLGLHKHPNHLTKKKKKKRSKEKKQKNKRRDDGVQEKKKEMSLLEEPASAKEHDGKKPMKKKALKEIYTFLIISNVMLWVIPEFGVHPQFENGIGRQYFGILTWFVLVTLCQPLSLFYRMHSTGLLTDILHTVRWETKSM